MILPQCTKPGFLNNLGNYNYVSSQLFNLTINTNRTRDGFERSWEALSQWEELTNQIRNLREQQN